MSRSVVAAGVLWGIAPAAADTQSTFTYQGSLENAGAPFDGVADVAVSVYQLESGSSPVGGTTAQVQVTGGLFTIEVPLDTNGLGTGTLWIEIGVREPGEPAYSTLTPRQPFHAETRSVQAGGAELIDSGETVFARTPVTEVEGYYTGSPVGGTRSSSAPWQSIVLQQSGELKALYFFGYAGPGDEITLRLYEGEGTGGALVAQKAAINTFGSGFVTSATISGVLLEAGATYTIACTVIDTGSGTPQPADYDFDAFGLFEGRSDFDPGADYNAGIQLRVAGPPGTFTTPTGDAQVLGRLTVLGVTADPDPVELPQDSIGADEIVDEPGVAYRRVNDSDVVAITGSKTTLTQRSIGVPGPGYVTATFEGLYSFNHANSTYSDVRIEIATNESALIDEYDTIAYVPIAAPSANYIELISRTLVFEIPDAGSYTFYVLGQTHLQGGVDGTLFGPSLLLTYLPTSYGQVEPDAVAAP